MKPARAQSILFFLDNAVRHDPNHRSARTTLIKVITIFSRYSYIENLQETTNPNVTKANLACSMKYIAKFNLIKENIY